MFFFHQPLLNLSKITYYELPVSTHTMSKTVYCFVLGIGSYGCKGMLCKSAPVNFSGPVAQWVEHVRGKNICVWDTYTQCTCITYTHLNTTDQIPLQNPIKQCLRFSICCPMMLIMPWPLGCIWQPPCCSEVLMLEKTQCTESHRSCPGGAPTSVGPCQQWSALLVGG